MCVSFLCQDLKHIAVNQKSKRGLFEEITLLNDLLQLQPCSELFSLFFVSRLLASIVQKADSTIHWLNRYPVDRY